jgi:hypothetical protein
MKSTIAFVYVWIHIPTKKWYVGSRTEKGCHPEDGYICSSKEVAPMIVENATEWQRLVIKTGDPQSMVELETKILKILNAKQDVMSFNKHNGDGKFSMTGKTGGRKGKTPWNKGLTKATANNIKGGKPKGLPSWNAGLKTGPAWNKGLTKETDERVASYAKTLSPVMKRVRAAHKGIFADKLLSAEISVERQETLSQCDS